MSLTFSVIEAWLCPGPRTGIVGGAGCGDDINPPYSVVPARRGACRLRRQLRVRVADGGQIGRPRPRVQLGEQTVAPRVGMRLRHAARLVVQVAEHDRLRRARGLARGDDLAVL